MRVEAYTPHISCVLYRKEFSRSQEVSASAQMGSNRMLGGTGVLSVPVTQMGNAVSQSFPRAQRETSAKPQRTATSTVAVTNKVNGVDLWLRTFHVDRLLNGLLNEEPAAITRRTRAVARMHARELLQKRVDARREARRQRPCGMRLEMIPARAHDGQLQRELDRAAARDRKEIRTITRLAEAMLRDVQKDQRRERREARRQASWQVMLAKSA